MSAALSLASAAECKWTVVSGPMKGAVRLLTSASFTIGRSPECEFVIVNDPKCSRRHAVVQLTPAGYEISAASDKNPVLVNGREIQRSPLVDGSVVTLGDTELLFNLATLPAMAPPPGAAPMYPNAGYAPAPPRRSPPKANNKMKVYIGGFLLIFAWLLFSETPKPKKQITIRDEQQINADIKEANLLRAAAEKKVSTQNQTIAQKEAQDSYVRGFRDFRKGQYGRALESFQACLALDPQHKLCTFYQRLAQRKFNELIEYNMVLGRKYRDQNQFRACSSAFRNVMVMVEDSTSPLYREAKANYDACTAAVEDDF